MKSLRRVRWSERWTCLGLFAVLQSAVQQTETVQNTDTLHVWSSPICPGGEEHIAII